MKRTTETQHTTQNTKSVTKTKTELLKAVKTESRNAENEPRSTRTLYTKQQAANSSYENVSLFFLFHVFTIVELTHPSNTIQEQTMKRAVGLYYTKKNTPTHKYVERLNSVLGSNAGRGVTSRKDSISKEN